MISFTWYFTAQNRSLGVRYPSSTRMVPNFLPLNFRTLTDSSYCSRLILPPFNSTSPSRSSFQVDEAKITSPLSTYIFFIKDLRVLVWVILYLLKHTGKDFQSKIFLVSQAVRLSLDHPDFVVHFFDYHQ